MFMDFIVYASTSCRLAVHTSENTNNDVTGEWRRPILKRKWKQKLLAAETQAVEM